jgi:hypothetical protein
VRRLAVCWLLAAAALGSGADSAAADKSGQGESRARPVTDYASLVASLRAAGASVKRGEAVEQPFFPVTGRMIQVHGEDVQVFQFADAAMADAQAARISPSGSTVGTTRVHWIGAPHFYKAGKLLVLYVGHDAKALGALQAVLGRQFAGQ